MELKMSVKNVKCINELNIAFPLEKGLYAITGENASGKSTLITCASTVFFNMPMKEYLGLPENANIDFSVDGATRTWECNGTQWKRQWYNKMRINGFYEGSLVFGNRFKNTKFSLISKLDKIKRGQLIEADNFVKQNLGKILHNNDNYYNELFELSRVEALKSGINDAIYFNCLEKEKIISQVRMSTGENLLISVLNSLKIVCNKRKNHGDDRPYIIFLDEIELALHSSALRRLVIFLKDISEEMDLAIFFSTHSIELLREISPQNIFYLSKNHDGSNTVTNPCYPAYATRNLYSDDGYGLDMVILVEDEMAQLVLEKIVFEKSLINNMRVKILPTGGWTNTITMAYDITSSNILLKGTRLAVILDKDIQDEVPSFISNNKQYSGVHYDFLPITSLEKYLRKNIYLSHNNEFVNYLNTYVFQRRPLQAVIENYQSDENDKDGKAFYGVLLNELKAIRKNRTELVEAVVKYIIKNDTSSVIELEDFIKEKIQ